MSQRLTLTPALLEQIIFAMEDQENTYVFDPGKAQVVLSDQAGGTFIPLPHWSSAQGFQLMRDFTYTLGNPLLKAQLTEILDLGHGVFKNFKNALKSHPQAAGRWNQYRLSALRQRVQEWAREWEEVWDLESLELTEVEDTTDLVYQDFHFSLVDQEAFVPIEEAWAQERSREEAWDDGSAWLAHRRSRRPWRPEDRFWEISTGDGHPIAGLGIQVWKSPDREVWTLETLYVQPDFRSLGLGKALMEKAMDQGRIIGVHSMIMEVPPDVGFFGQTLERSDFTPSDRRWVLTLGEEYTDEDPEEMDF